MKSWFKKQMAVLMTLVLAFSVTIPALADGTDEEVQTVKVTLSGQYDNEFFFAPGEYEIPSNEAETYGYEDEQGGVTTLDALVYAHKLAYGDKFTKDTKDDYLTMKDHMEEENGSEIKDGVDIATAFGKNSISFMVNDRYPNVDGERYTIDQAKLADDDQVGFFGLQDFMMGDLCTWFEENGKKVKALTLEEKNTTELVLRGFAYMWNGSSSEDEIDEIADVVGNAKIMLIKEDGESELIENAVTDEKGTVTITGLSAGDYYLSAYMPKEDDTFIGTPIIMPLCKLHVKAKETEEPKKDDPTETTTEATTTEATTEVTTEATTEVTTETTTEAPAKVNYSKIPLQTGKTTNVIQINDGKTKIKKATVNNKNIVSVTVKNGKLQIKAKKKGKAIITITDENGQESKVTVEVKKSVPIKKLSLNKKKLTLKVKQKEKLVVTKNPVTAVTKLKWSTSNKKIATVDQSGKVKAKKKGEATITVKASNGKKASCKVTVK